MPDTPDFFPDHGPEFAPGSAARAVVAGLVISSAGKPSATQKRFNKLVAAIDAAREESEALRGAVEALVPAHVQALQQLSDELTQLKKEMVVFLDARLQLKGLTPTQKKHATWILLSLCEHFEHVQDEVIDAVRARYVSPEDVAERAQADAQAAQEAKEFMAGVLGKKFADQDFKSPQEVLQAAMEHELAQAQARDAKSAAQKARRAANARGQAAAQMQLDAQSALRTIYRQLVSALHPDRASDAADHERKTVLMKEVNTAYERRDLPELLRLQLAVEQVDASKLAAMPDEKLKAMCVLLDEQFKALQKDISEQRMALEAHFGCASRGRFRTADLQDAMAAQRQELQQTANFMRYDLARAQDDKLFKVWLREQARLFKEVQRESQALADMDDMILDMMLRRY